MVASKHLRWAGVWTALRRAVVRQCVSRLAVIVTSFVWGQVVRAQGDVAPEVMLGPQLNGHSLSVKGVAFSPDGRWLASGSQDGTVRVWEVGTRRTARELRSANGYGQQVLAVAFSPDGRWLASAGGDQMVRLWEAGTGREVQAFRGHTGEVLGVVFSPDGRWLASASEDGNVRVWEAGTGRESQILRPANAYGPIMAVAFSPDGRWLASASQEGTVRIWEAGTGRETRVLRPANYYGQRLMAVAFSPDGRWLASASYEGTVRVWDAGTGREVRVLVGSNYPVRGVVFSPDGRWLVSAGNDGLVRVWESETGRETRVLRGHSRPVLGVAFSPDGRWLASASDDATVRLLLPELKSSILAEHPSLARRMVPKDQFETTEEFTARIDAARTEYLALLDAQVKVEFEARQRRVAESRKRITLPATSVVLGTYAADRKRYPLTVDGFSTEIEIPPMEARELFQRSTEIIVEAFEQVGPDLKSTQRVNLQLVHPTTLTKYPIGPQVPIADAVVAAAKPAVLEIGDPKFTDTDGDNRLGAGERAVLQFTVRNAGEGPGQGLRVVGSGTTAIDGLTASVGRIEPGETKPVTMTLVGGAALQDGAADLRFEVREANGFNAPPLAVKIPTYAFRPPQLEVAEVGVEDVQGSSVIRNGQVVTLTIRVRNAGQGRATGVVADVVPGTGVSLAEVPDPRRTVLRVGDLEAGAFRDVRVKAFANAEVQGRFPIEVALRESSNRFAVAAKDLGLALVTPQRSVAQLEVTAREAVSAATGAAAAPRLASDLLASIPMAKQENAEAIAVIIGNRSYQNAPGVAFAANDAAVMRQYAERALGIRPGNVIYLEDATLTNLQVVFGREGDPSGRLKDLVKPGVSEVFVFYSGHGAPDQSERKAYLMPVDADAARLRLSGFSVDVLYANLAALKAKHVTVVLDACFSGATGGGEMLITAASPIGIQVNDPSARFGAQGATILTAAAGQQLANWYPERRHGLFTYFFLKGLQGSADADGDGAITLGEMQRWLANPTAGVPYESRRLYGTNREQRPQIWGDPARALRP